ncbi:PH domain-containing protein [uncultured Corynebacterium sp.]|uniref:PH domain-containing protein n=1 Tax=uncultured Corynebacterium sp. TaxID=159447 RepID=UPI0025CEE3A8|nr:PH domain-containing protein [uncultured Corynebacterium sp.]
MWAALVGVAAVILFQQAETLRWVWDRVVESPLPGVVVIPVVLAVLVGVFLLGWLLSWPWWRATRWRVDDEAISVRRGVLSTQLRTARFDRVQAVDLIEPLAPRLFRLAGVRVETAGGADSAVSVEYLPRARAEQLRDALLGRVRVLPDAPDGPDAPAAPEPAARPGTVVVPQIPATRSLAAAVLAGPTAVTLLIVLVSAATPAGLALLLPAVAGLGPWIWGLLNRSWRFTAVLSGRFTAVSPGRDDDRLLVVTFGFSERRRQTVPLDRIHAVRVSQPLLWRPLGWWKVDVDIAGYGEPGQGGATTAVLPVGTLDQAFALVALLGPLDRGQVDTLVRPGRVPEPRAGVRVYRSPASARWVSPVDRTRQAVVLVAGEGSGRGTDRNHDTALVCHCGRWRRSASVIDPAHVQELSHRRGPLRRMLGLATVRFDLVPGPVTMVGRDLSSVDAVDLLTRLRQRTLPTGR